MLRRRFAGYGEASPSLEEQLITKLADLKAIFRLAVEEYIGGYGGLFPGVKVVQDVLGASSSVGKALITTNASIDLLGGDLFDAVLGDHVFPLDVGTKANPAAALATWNQLAQGVQDTCSGVLGYIGKWGPLPGLAEGAKFGLNPLNWPWWLQLTAAAVAVGYGTKALAFVGRARRDVKDARGALGGYSRGRKRLK